MIDFQAVCELLRSRRSIREFDSRRPDRDRVRRLIEAACWAPSNHNRQGWKFIVFEDPRTIARLASDVRGCLVGRLAQAPPAAARHAEEVLGFSTGFAKAPVVILAMHKHSAAVGDALLAGATGPLASGEALSTAMAVQNLLLAAHAMGLGACVMTAPLLAGEVWSALGDLPTGFEPTCLVALGYPAGIPAPPRRKPLEHVLEFR